MGWGGACKKLFNLNMTSNIFVTFSNSNKLKLCGIRNTSTARDACATDNLRITSGGQFFVVVVM